MSIRNLQPLLHPRSIALIGASIRPGSLGAILLDNVRAGGYSGPVYAVNPNCFSLPHVHWARSAAALPAVPDLAIVMTPAAEVPAVVAELGALGTRCAVIISAGVTAASGLRQQMLDAAKPYCMRLVGPNCIGVMAPHIGLNATFARTRAAPGRLALISQSGALVTAILDWADTRGIGFSGVVSAGDMADADIGDLIDLFAIDPATDAILLYVEGITDAAKFMSAARAAALGKPVIAIKAGRSPAAAKATLSHTGALTGSYDVYRAAFDRAGILAVDTLGQMFDAAEILTAYRQSPGNRLGIVTNGGGAGILAVDALAPAGAVLANLSQLTLLALASDLPPTWSHGNPVDIVGDAGPDRYASAIGALLRDDQVDALLVMNCPTAMADAADVAEAIAAAVSAARADGIRKPVIACWLGDRNRASALAAMRAVGVPVYGTPEDAVRSFGYLLAADRSRIALVAAPAEHRTVSPDISAAQAIIAAARADHRTVLTEIEAKALLGAYGIATAPTRFVASPEALSDACGAFPPPYAVKIVSPDINHKSDVGGVALHLTSRKAAMAAACAMETRIAAEHPEMRIAGYALEAMIERSHSHELIAGLATDPTFGKLLVVGAGGTAVEIIADRALALPPIDHAQAEALLGATRIAKQLAGYRSEPAADIGAVANVLDALSAIAVGLPDIADLDINPLLVDPGGAIALDARIHISAEPQASANLAIRPAPMAWAADLETRSGYRFHVRPVRADDEALLAEFFAHVTPEDMRFRFLSALNSIDHDRLAMMTRVDYRRTISFLGFAEDGKSLVATAMLAADPDRSRAEVALTTRADMKGRGISWTLFEHVLRYAEAERIPIVEALEFADHDSAIRMERELGFTSRADPDDPTLRIVRRDFETRALEDAP